VDGFYYVYCLRVDPGRKSVVELHGVAGDHHEFPEQALNSELAQFVSWIKSMEFGGKRDESRTYDILRYFEKNIKNPEWLERLCSYIQTGDLSGLQYELSQDFEIALGQKDLIMEFDLAEYVAPSNDGPAGPLQEDLSGLIPLSFVVSPFSGTPLIRLSPGDRIHVRFASPREPRTVNYLRRTGLKPGESGYETDARVESLGTRPVQKDVLVKLKLDGGAGAFILEENHDIRVKMADVAGKKRRGRQADADEAPIGGQLLLVLLVIVFGCLAGLLYAFLF
jgi:hypothetical protein